MSVCICAYVYVVVVVVDANRAQLRFKKFSTLDIIFLFDSDNAKTMELQTGDHSGLDRLPVAFTKASVVSQFATFTTTYVYMDLR